MLYGGLDRTIARGAIDELVERLGGRGTLRLYPERHHLLLHETGAEELFAECQAWLAPAGAAGPEAGAKRSATRARGDHAGRGS